MSTDTAGAILQRDKKTWALKPHTPLGIITPAEMERIAQAAGRHGVQSIKMTSGQRFILLGVPEQELASLKEELGPLGELCRNYVQACPGLPHCKFAKQDSMDMGRQIEALVFGKTFPAKVKIGVSACPFSCGESQVRDIGLIGTAKGWRIYVGGNSGTRPRIADRLCEGLSTGEAVEVVQRFLELYSKKEQSKKRIAVFVAKHGVEQLRKELDMCS